MGDDAMKYWGGLLLLAYAAVTTLGFEPFTNEQRVTQTRDGTTRRSHGVWPFFWSSGYRGGK
jgi:hypothetical protein